MEDFWVRAPLEAPVRTRTEIIIKTIALHVAVIAAAGHLTSLERQSRKHSTAVLWQLAWFFVVPTYPIAVLLNRVIQSASTVHRRGYRSVNLSYCLGAILGLHVEGVRGASQDSVHSIPLYKTNPGDVHKVSQKRDWFWAGRVIILLGFMTQSTATLVLSGRRLQAGQMGEIDTRNALVALGGLWVQLISAIISLVNVRWEYITDVGPLSPADRRSSRRKPVFKVLTTASVILSSFNFRFHIMDMFSMAAQEAEAYSAYPPTTYLWPGPARSSLVLNFVWLLWPIMIYLVQESSELLTLLISAFLSLSFPIEELVEESFPTWKDPLAEKLYAF